MGAAGGGAGLNVEDVFSAYLYDGTNAHDHVINNGIDLSGEGGLVWIKSRDVARNHALYDTERGVNKYISSNTTSASTDLSSSNDQGLKAFNSNGFTVDDNELVNANDPSLVSWTFRKAPKFFDVVTYTGSDSTQTINHSLASEVGFMVVKRVSSGTGQWYAHHRSLTSGHIIKLNSTDASTSNASSLLYNVTSTSFTVDAGAYHTNAAGETYVAYLFAHNNNDGGFGPDGDADIIKCGTYEGNGGTQEIALGFEPQWVMIKNIESRSYQSYLDWNIFDNMREFTNRTSGDNDVLIANGSDAETALARCFPTANGFAFYNDGAYSLNYSGDTYIYMAIRRGTAVPTSATEVFEPIEWSYSSNGEYTLSNLSFMDTFWHKQTSGSQDHMRYDRLRGTTTRFRTDGAQEISDTNSWDTLWDNMNKFKSVSSAGGEWQGDQIGFAWKRAPSFFDVVAYTGSGGAGSHNHNLSATPEMIIFKNRGSNQEYIVYHKDLTAGKHLRFNGSNAELTGELTTSFAVSDTQFTFANDFITTNNSSYNYMAYLFTTLGGVSKVGSVSHSGSSTDVNCGFSNGARFVMLKRTDATGDWFVWNSVRGIVSGNDPYILLNTTSAEVTSTDYIDPLSSGFTISDDFTDGTYIFYAIA